MKFDLYLFLILLTNVWLIKFYGSIFRRSEVRVYSTIQRSLNIDPVVIFAHVYFLNWCIIMDMQFKDISLSQSVKFWFRYHWYRCLSMWCTKQMQLHQGSMRSHMKEQSRYCKWLRNKLTPRLKHLTCGCVCFKCIRLSDSKYGRFGPPLGLGSHHCSSSLCRRWSPLLTDFRYMCLSFSQKIK